MALTNSSDCVAGAAQKLDICDSSRAAADCKHTVTQPTQAHAEPAAAELPAAAAAAANYDRDIMQWQFQAGARGRGAQAPPKCVARPPNLAILWTQCGQLILRKISKFDATRCQILRLKCNAQNSISAGLAQLRALPQTP